MRCGAEITLCMGSVLARDMLRALAGEIPWTSVREHCGRCVMWIINDRRRKKRYFRRLDQADRRTA